MGGIGPPPRLLLILLLPLLLSFGCSVLFGLSGNSPHPEMPASVHGVAPKW